jgi:hypothetical protein
MENSMNKYFNTSGSCLPTRHYMLGRDTLVQRGMDLVRAERYFTIWAPRQTGKTTYFRLLKTKLEKIGYKVLYINNVVIYGHLAKI